MWKLTLGSTVPILMVAALSGCGEVSFVMGSTWHQKFGWKAEDYFSDPKVIALCRAIEANDIPEIDHLVKTGADVNAKGKGNMTPLLWAFPDNNLNRFERLLELGAEPNVITESDFNTHGGLESGESVTHMACATEFPGYFEAVFAHGGDPNLIRKGRLPGETPLFSVITGRGPKKLEHVQTLIDKRADLNHMNGISKTPAMQAVSWGGQFDIALQLLNAGADYKIYQPNTNIKLIHIIAMERNSNATPSAKQVADYETLVNWMQDHGESLQQALADIKRWKSWSWSSGEYRRNMDAEIAEREAKEATEKKAAADKSDQKKK